MSAEVIGNVSRLAIYPIKGAGMVEVKSAQLTPGGLVGDREYMVVKATPDENGVFHFVTQRDQRSKDDKPQGLSVLAKVKPQLDEEALTATWEGDDPVAIPYDRVEGIELPVNVWDSFVTAVDQGDEIAEWFSDHLKFGVRLVRAVGPFTRLANQNYLANTNPVKFQDAYSLHWFTQQSVDELSKKAGQDIPWTRFRPNMVAEAKAPRVEHEVFRGAVAGVEFVQPKPCDRCPVTTVDQEIGLKMGDEPLKTLARYKQWRNNRGYKKVIFGENMLPFGEAEVNIGNEIVVFERRNPPLVYGAKV